MGTFMTHIPRCVYLGIGVIMGSVIKSARKLSHYQDILRQYLFTFIFKNINYIKVKDYEKN